MAAAMGVMVKKMLFQEKCSSSHPPTIGPRAMATPVVAPQSPMALARSPRSVKVLEIRDSVASDPISVSNEVHVCERLLLCSSKHRVSI